MHDNHSPITSQDENYMVENDNSHESTPHIDLPSQDMNGQSENDEGIIIDIYRIDNFPRKGIIKIKCFRLKPVLLIFYFIICRKLSNTISYIIF